MAEELGREAAEGKTRIHIVKHAPKTEDQVLEDLMKKHQYQKEAENDARKSVKKDAKAEFKRRK